MECAFKDLENRNCFSRQRCEGIYQLVLEIGGKKEFAKKYSKYVLRRTLLNKIIDKKFDPNHGIEGFFTKLLIKLVEPISRIVCEDIFGIEG
ncbi:MAG: hypothetical protein GY870_05045 [archaeon]|nr:hypothetical protein [archaeon]